MLVTGHVEQGTFFVSEHIQQQTVEAAAIQLQQAYEHGVQIGQGLTDTQESTRERVGVLGPGHFLDRARLVISGVIDRIRDLIVSALSADNRKADASDNEEAQATVEHVKSYLPDEVGITEIHREVEQGVMSVMLDTGVQKVQWVTSPGACERCVANEEASPIDINEEFPSGDTVAPCHVNCRCNVIPAGIR